MGGRDELSRGLAELLGFEEGTADILDHLLSIETEEDLLDYLSQLLGQNGDQVKSLVENVGRFKRGESVTKFEKRMPAQNLAKKDSRQNQPKVTPQKNNHGVATTNNTMNKPKQKQTKGTQQKPKPAAKKTDKITIIAPKKKTPTAHQQSKPTNHGAAALKEHSAQKSHPPKGKASKVCGCFGNIHKPLTNCLYCGRISCQEEGFDFCPFCGHLVERISQLDGSSDDPAWLHKERLLRFDREFAQRTVVLDDQADYYTNSTSQWLDGDERAEAATAEEQRVKDLHTRAKQTLDIEF